MKGNPNKGKPMKGNIYMYIMVSLSENTMHLYVLD